MSTPPRKQTDRQTPLARTMEIHFYLEPQLSEREAAYTGETRKTISINCSWSWSPSDSRASGNRDVSHWLTLSVSGGHAHDPNSAQERGGIIVRGPPSSHTWWPGQAVQAALPYCGPSLAGTAQVCSPRGKEKKPSEKEEGCFPKAWIPPWGSPRPRARQQRHTPWMGTSTQEALEGVCFGRSPLLPCLEIS